LVLAKSVNCETTRISKPLSTTEPPTEEAEELAGVKSLLFNTEEGGGSI